MMNVTRLPRIGGKLNTGVSFVALLVVGIIGSLIQPVHAQMLELTPDVVVATRGGVDLTLDLVDQEMAKMPDEVREGYLDDPQRFGRLIDSLLLTSQLADEAIKQGVELPLDAPAQGEKSSLSYLNKLAGELLRQRVSVRSDEEYELLASERYRSRKANYAGDEFFTIRSFHSDPSVLGPVAAKIIAESVRARVLGGESLAELKEQQVESSENISEEITLTLADVLRSGKSLVQPLGQIGKKPGVSEVVESDAGYHLVELVRYDPPVVPAYEEIREQLIEEIKGEAVSNARTTYMRSFSLQDVALNNPVIQVLPERYRSQTDQGLLQ